MIFDDFEVGSEIEIEVDGELQWHRVMHRFQSGGWTRRVFESGGIDESRSGLRMAPGHTPVGRSRKVPLKKRRKSKAKRSADAMHY